MEIACHKGNSGIFTTASYFVLIAFLTLGILQGDAQAGVLVRKIRLKTSPRVINSSQVIARTNPTLSVGRGTARDMDKVTRRQIKYEIQLDRWEARRDQAIAKAKVQREQELAKLNKERERRAAKAAAAKSKPSHSFSSIFGGSEEPNTAKVIVDKKSEAGSSSVLRNDEPGQPKKKQSFWARLWHAMFG